MGIGTKSLQCFWYPELYLEQCYRGQWFSAQALKPVYLGSNPNSTIYQNMLLLSISFHFSACNIKVIVVPALYNNCENELVQLIKLIKWISTSEAFRTEANKR